MAPAPLDVKLEIILDHVNQQRYFPGDAVHGKVFFTANQSHTIRNFRLAWTGAIHVQPIKSNKDQSTYFDECWKLGPTVTKSPTKAQKGTSSVPCYTSELLLTATSSVEPKVQLQKNKTVALAFTVHVPNDRPLPSHTASSGASPNKIIYMLEAFVDKPADETQKKFFAKRIVPVFETIYTRTPDMMVPQRAEQAFIVSLLSGESDTAAMRVTLPCRGCLPGIAIPVSISIWNKSVFTRKQGMSISLFRINQVLANGRAYTSQGEKVHRVVTDVNVAELDSNNHNQRVQTVRISLPIPRGTVPSITLEQSQLLAISYFIRVQVFGQDGMYTTADGKRSQFMIVDLPFVIGTMSSPSDSSSSPSTSPMSSPKSVSSNSILYTSTTASPPPPTYQQSLLTSPPISAPLISSSFISTPSMCSPPLRSPPISSPPLHSPPLHSPPISSPPLNSSTMNSPLMNAQTPPVSSPPITSPSLSNISLSRISLPIITSSATGTERKSRIGGMFRKSSTGSQAQTSEEKRSEKKKGVFSSFRLYSSRKKNQQEDGVDQNEKTSASVEPEDQVSAASDVLLTPLVDNASHITEPAVPTDNALDELAGDVPEEEEEELDLQDTGTQLSGPTVFSEMKRDQSCVFKMFPDDDDDDDEEEEEEEPDAIHHQEGPESNLIQEQAPKRKHINRKEATFQIFPNQDEDSEDEPVAVIEEKQLQVPDSDTTTMDTSSAAPVGQPLKKSNVFQMFNDDDEEDDSSSEEEVENDVAQAVENEIRVKPHLDDPRHQKPNEFIIEYKPDSKDTETDHP